MKKQYIYLDMLIAFINAILMIVYAIEGKLIPMALSLLIITLTFICTFLKIVMVGNHYEN
jgi:hypothetical protein